MLKPTVQPICPDHCYPIAAIKQTAGVGDAWLRSARRDGLAVVRIGGRCFIRGRDFTAFVDAMANRQEAEVSG